MDGTPDRKVRCRCGTRRRVWQTPGRGGGRVLALAAGLLATPGAADDRLAPIFGRWGDAAQCAGALLTEGGTVRAEPFELSAGWLRHGRVWCRLGWFAPEIREDGLFVSARAGCGEDQVRDYRLDVLLKAGTLLLIWDEALVNGPLARCEP